MPGALFLAQAANASNITLIIRVMRFMGVRRKAYVMGFRLFTQLALCHPVEDLQHHPVAKI
jgi:hypothetical protein